MNTPVIDLDENAPHERRARSQPFFQPGHNCAGVHHASRFSLLIDGADYFRALREAITRAQRTVFIVGWDIDSRMQLMPEGADDGFADGLGDFLHEVVAARKRLRIYILAWDFAMLYAFEREWLPVYRMGWRTRRRAAFHMDGKHPLGASHHQKIVVIDDRIAFVGGLDLTRSRWDTSDHAAKNPLRRDANGQPYRPFHDVYMLFDCDAARAMGLHVRERWRRACGRRFAIRAHRAMPERDPWPVSRSVDLENVDLAIALTEPAYAGRPGVQQIRAQYLDAIAHETQHLYREPVPDGGLDRQRAARDARAAGRPGSHDRRAALSKWLAAGKDDGRAARAPPSADGDGRPARPLPDHVAGCAGARTRLRERAQQADVHRRRLAAGRSANLNNRWMVLDTECNLAVDANGDPRIRVALAKMRNTLLAEHLGCEVEDVAREIATRLGMNDAIAALQRDPTGHRTLQRLNPTVSDDIDRLVPLEALVDPEEPVEPDQRIGRFVPVEKPAGWSDVSPCSACWR
jgi:phospholipase D1/2